VYWGRGNIVTVTDGYELAAAKPAVSVIEPDAATELPEAVAAQIDSWGRVFAHAAGAECSELLGRAAADLWRGLAINKTIHPDSQAVAHQAVVDRLARWADAQRQRRAIAEYLAGLEAEAGPPDGSDIGA
jgi:hypothetical protein